MRIIFDCAPIYTSFRCIDASAKEIFRVVQVIQEATQARPDGYNFMPKYRAGLWDGYIRLTKGSSFPTGLLPLVTDKLREADLPYIQVNNYDTPERDINSITPDMFDGMTLRPYQVDAARLLSGHGRGIANMATNSGKTAVFAAMIKCLSGGALVLVTGKDLLYQHRESLECLLREPVGVVGDGHWRPKRVTVGTIQTLSKHLERIAKFDNLDLVVYDECHHIPSKTSQQVMYGIEAPLRYGFSGTPLSHDLLSDLILIGATGPVLTTVTNAQLVDSGISAKPVVRMYTVESDDSMFDASWAEAVDSLIVHNQVRNALIAHAVNGAESSSTLVLVNRLEHGSLLQELIPGSVFVNGSSATLERQDALNKLRDGSGTIVIATPIFDEGVDVPAVDLLVLAGGGKSPKKLLQRLGRGMRRKPGDNILHVIDFVDDTNKFLLDHSLEHAKVYEQEGFDVEIVE